MATYIFKSKGVVSEREILERYPSLSSLDFSIIASSCRDILRVGEKQYASMNLFKLKNKDIVVLKNSLVTLLNENNGYTTEKSVFDKVTGNTAGQDILNKYRIMERIGLFSIMEGLFGNEILFSRPHIVIKGKIEYKNLNSLGIIEMLFPQKIMNYLDVRDKLLSLGWTEGTTRSMLPRMLERRIRIDENIYVLEENGWLDDISIKKLENYFKKLTANGNYRSILSFYDFSELPDVGFDWNVYLLGDIMRKKELGVKIIEPSPSDRRYPRGIIVSKDCKCNTYDELIAKILRDEGIRQIKESDLPGYLQLKGLCGKTMPIMLYNCDAISFKDNIFTVM